MGDGEMKNRHVARLTPIWVVEAQNTNKDAAKLHLTASLFVFIGLNYANSSATYEPLPQKQRS